MQDTFSLPKTGLTLTSNELIKRSKSGDVEACFKLSEISEARVGIEIDVVGVAFIIGCIGLSTISYLLVANAYWRWAGVILFIILGLLSTSVLKKHQITLKIGTDTVVYDSIDAYTLVPQFVAMINQHRRALLKLDPNASAEA